MPINVENPLAFSFIMQDDIFLLADDRAGFKKPVTNPAEVESTPLLTTVPEAEPISRPDPVNFSYYGGNKKNFLVIVHYPGHELMDESHFTALESTLSRLGFNTDDVAILNRAKYADTAITVLEEYFRPQKLLLMGKDSLAYGLAAPEPNKINNSSGYPVLYTFSFAGMMNSSENKKVFWEQVKQL